MCLRTSTWLTRQKVIRGKGGQVRRNQRKKRRYVPGKRDWAILSDSEVSQKQDEQTHLLET